MIFEFVADQQAEFIKQLIQIHGRQARFAGAREGKNLFNDFVQVIDFLADDAVVLVARAGFTPAKGLRYAVEQLRAVRAQVVGTVLNGIDKREASYDNAYDFFDYASMYHEMAPRGPRATVAFAAEPGS